ncbi:ribonuclease P protein component [Candidatus Tremblaya phenacola]|uniref:ribonuclease P protein component n=1 Tax=Candidatus Tremblayella phenacoccinincola TaxID=1010676 RepID=UPI00132FA44D|nr:ribonuclease P protein component [Candidatus Tremblaya phenacola]KAH0998168.1 hypothetical protein FKM95_000217 [Candidatus Tremblaya phenacola]
MGVSKPIKEPRTIVMLRNMFSIGNPRVGIIIIKTHIKLAYERSYIKRLSRESIRIISLLVN